MIKRMLALVLIVFACIPLGAQAENHDAFFSELGNYVLYVDRLLEDELFVIKYVEKFNESRTYDDLLIARCAVESALREIERMELPQMAMTEDEYFAYMLNGVEIEALSLLYEELETVVNGVISTLTIMMDTLIADVFFEPALDNLMEEIALYRNDILYEARDLVYLMNYLLVQLNDRELSEKFWDVIKRDSIVVKEEMGTFYSDAELIISLTSDNLDQMDENISKIYVLIDGFETYFMNVTMEAAETGDLNIFKNNRTEIIGENQVFPMPEWCLPSEMEYTYIFSEPGTDKLFIHTMGNEIPYAPDRIKITINGITIDEISEYVDYLSILEYNPVYEFATEGDEITLYVMSEKGNSTLVILWNERETILYLMPPAASLVPYMYWK